MTSVELKQVFAKFKIFAMQSMLVKVFNIKNDLFETSFIYMLIIKLTLGQPSEIGSNRLDRNSQTIDKSLKDIEISSEKINDNSVS